MRIRKSKLFFTLGLICSFWSMSVMCFGYSAASLATTLTLKAGTPVLLRVEKSMTSKTAHVGDSVDLIVVRDVKIDGKIVISAGTLARGEISSVDREGVVGKPGNISITVKSVTAVDGQDVLIRASLTREGKGKQTTALLVGLLLCVIGIFLIKGEGGTIKAGSEIKAYVDFDIEIDVK